MSRWLARTDNRSARGYRRLRQPVWPVRRALTDPWTPVLLMAVGAAALAVPGYLPTWAVIGGLAGYTLSGSV